MKAIETLYKTKDEYGEFYELVFERQFLARTGFFVREIHGWWDETGKQCKDPRQTYGPSPEEGQTFEDARLRYEQQRLHRAKEGFRFSCTLDLFTREVLWAEIETDSARSR